MEKRLFISHSTEDKEIVKEVANLMVSIGLSSEQIICTSIAGYDNISLGEDFLNGLKEKISSDVFILFILTHNFYKSPFCLSEMGASWVLAKESIPIVVPPFTFNDMKGVIPKTKQGVVISDKNELSLLLDKINKAFGIQQHSSLSEKIDDFIEKITVKTNVQTTMSSSTELSDSDDDCNLLELVKQKGIKDIKDNILQNYTPVVNKLKVAKKSIKILAYFGESVFNGLKSTLFDKLVNEEFEEPFEIKVLTSRNNSVISPENYKFIKEVKKLEKSAMGFKKHNDVKNCIEEIRKKTKKEKRKIGVGYYNTQVRYAVTIIDEEWAWWTPYHPGIPTEECISLELVNKGKGSFFDLCNMQFENLWSIAKMNKKNDL